MAQACRQYLYRRGVVNVSRYLGLGWPAIAVGETAGASGRGGTGLGQVGRGDADWTVGDVAELGRASVSTHGSLQHAAVCSRT